MRRSLLIIAFVAAAGALAWLLVDRLLEGKAATKDSERRLPVPVEVARIDRGTLVQRRSFSGTLEASSQFVVAPKVGGQIASIRVDLGDAVQRGQLVATIDDAEFVQAVQRAEAELAVANAGLAEAEAALTIAVRGLERARSMHEGEVLSDSILDTAVAKELASRSKAVVSKSNVTRAEAELASAKIRLGYTQVRAEWNGGKDTRYVGARYVDDGGVVAANADLLSVVELDPIVAVVSVPERDYAALTPGQRATLRTDAFAGRDFDGSIARISPVFRQATRQARVELRFDNRERALKPGMFVRTTLELVKVDDAISVPYEALTERDGVRGVFTVTDDGAHVAWKPVRVGVRDGARIQITEGLDDLKVGTNVVTLGQALCDDGAAVVVPGARDKTKSED
ncbi:MAG: efflux RND transporter periplasmic adaptor subunit [Planctomycetes bacterium]|nr:efflux RND transporter periplasmic adaptor subunit [Planctomycetota bacterium]MCB9917084.1 efflux RND transporter periplasmic adaptor subunit [Planctomycetota bacterium]